MYFPPLHIHLLIFEGNKLEMKLVNRIAGEMVGKKETYCSISQRNASKMVNEWKNTDADVITCQLIGHNLAYAVNDRV